MKMRGVSAVFSKGGFCGIISDVSGPVAQLVRARAS